MNARDYYLKLQNIIHAAPYVLSSDLLFEEIDVNECYIRGVLTLITGFQLHIAEYVVTKPTLRRPKYRYHLQTSGGKLVSRWDNVPHHPAVATFPDHRHDDQGGIHPSSPMSVPEVMRTIWQFI